MATKNRSPKESTCPKLTDKESTMVRPTTSISTEISHTLSHANQFLRQDDERPHIRLIPIQVVQEILGVGRTFVIEHSANNQMPRPVKFGTSRRAAVRWFEHEILDYVMTLAAQRDQQTSNNQDISPDGTFDRSEGQDM